MGRGRKSLIHQSERRAIPSRGQSERGTPTIYLFTPNREIKKIFVPEQAFDFMKNMNPHQLVDFLLPTDADWHFKTSSGNASGRQLNILHTNLGLFTCDEAKIFHA